MNVPVLRLGNIIILLHNISLYSISVVSVSVISHVQ